MLRLGLAWLTRGPIRASLLALCLCLGLAMPFMRVIPFAGTTVALIVFVSALTLIARDGLMAMIAVAVPGVCLVGTMTAPA